MPTTTEEPLHPSFAEHDAAREEFLNEAAQVFEDRRAPINPIADKLSQATPYLREKETVKPDAASSRSPAKAPAATPPSSTDPNPSPTQAGKISGLVTPESSEAGQPSASVAQSASPPDPDADIPGPDEYRGGKGFVDNWKKLHGAKDHWKQEALAAKQQLEKLQAGGQTKSGTHDPEIIKHVQALQQENQNLIARLEAVAVEKSPRFEAAFRPRIESAIQLAKQAVGPERAAHIEKLLTMPESTFRDEQLDQILNEMGTGMRHGKLTQAVAEYDRINAEKQALSSRGSEVYKQWQSEEQANMTRQQQARQKEALQTFDNELQGFKSVVNDDDAATAREVFNGQADLQSAARASLWAVYGPKVAGQAMAANKRIKELEAELSKFRSVQPGKGNAGGSPQVSDEVPEGTSYADAIGRLVSQQGLLR